MKLLVDEDSQARRLLDALRHTMNHAQIVRAIDALQAAGLPVQGQFHILNHWR